MTMKFDATSDPLTLPELRGMKEMWKTNAIISALVEAAINRRLPPQKALL